MPVYLAFSQDNLAIIGDFFPADNDGDEGGEGYNSEDEYSHLGAQLTEEEWQAKERKFEKIMRKKGYIIKHMGDDGSCLFRAVADQVSSLASFFSFSTVVCLFFK